MCAAAHAVDPLGVSRVGARFARAVPGGVFSVSPAAMHVRCRCQSDSERTRVWQACVLVRSGVIHGPLYRERSFEYTSLNGGPLRVHGEEATGRRWRGGCGTHLSRTVVLIPFGLERMTLVAAMVRVIYVLSFTSVMCPFRNTNAPSLIGAKLYNSEALLLVTTSSIQGQVTRRSLHGGSPSPYCKRKS